jgi:hypothetical protein
MSVALEYSFSPRGEKFRLPGPDDYLKESERLKVLVNQHRSCEREIVVVQGLGRGHANPIKNRMQKQKEEMLLQISEKPPLAIHTA